MIVAIIGYWYCFWSFVCWRPASLYNIITQIHWTAITISEWVFKECKTTFSRTHVSSWLVNVPTRFSIRCGRSLWFMTCVDVHMSGWCTQGIHTHPPCERRRRSQLSFFFNLCTENQELSENSHFKLSVVLMFPRILSSDLATLEGTFQSMATASGYHHHPPFHSRFGPMISGGNILPLRSRSAIPTSIDPADWIHHDLVDPHWRAPSKNTSILPLPLPMSCGRSLYKLVAQQRCRLQRGAGLWTGTSRHWTGLRWDLQI